MLISRTPFRMSFFGGGTDMEEFFRENGGAVLSTTFDKYCYVVARRLPEFFDYKSEFIYSEIERVREASEIKHPAIRNAMMMLDAKNIRLSYEADLPARSGLGTSSSFAVGMLNALHTLEGEELSKRQLSDEAIYLERVLCNEAGGWQDQIAAAYGGLNKIVFDKNGYEVLPIKIPTERKEKLNNNLMMFFTGFTRFSSEVQNQNKSNSNEIFETKRKMLELVYEAEKILESEERDLGDFGRLLDYSWKLKKKTGKAVSNEKIDALYERGMRAGAVGGKLLGAGSGGFLIFYVPLEKQEAVINELRDLMFVPFRFEDTGTKIIYNSENNTEKEKNERTNPTTETISRFISGTLSEAR